MGFRGMCVMVGSRFKEAAMILPDTASVFKKSMKPVDFCENAISLGVTNF